MIRRILSCAIIVVAMTGIQYAYRLWLGALPEIKTPTPQLPTPNAYDYYVKASNALIAAPSDIDPIFDRESIPQAQWKTRYPLAKKQAWLKQNATTLHLIRQGFAHTSRVPSRRTGEDFTDQDSLRKKLRNIARMLIVESRVHSEQGQWNAAAASALDCLRMGYDLMQGGNTFDFLVGSSTCAIGIRELWTVLPRLDTQQARKAAQRLEKLESTQVSSSNVLQEEKYYGQARMIKAMQEMPVPYTFYVSGSDSSSFRNILKTFTTSRRAVFSNYTHYMDQLISYSEKPYSSTSLPPKAPDDLYSQILTSSHQRFHWYYTRAKCNASLLRVALILHAYKLEHRHYPQTLNELTPRYLEEMPQDPFGSGEPLKYKRTSEKYTLYSIGADGIDDNGRAIENKKEKNERRRFLTQPESKGDFVAGVNY